MMPRLCVLISMGPQRIEKSAGNPACGRGQKRGNKTGAGDEALGRSHGGFSTKVHLRAEGRGRLITLLLTPGQRNEARVFEQLMEQGAVRRAGRGRPRLRPDRVVGDKGYSSGKIRRYCRSHGMSHTIPRRSTEKRRGPFNKTIYKTRNLIERLFNRYKQFKRLATRYEKRAESYRAMWIIAAIWLWL